MSRFVLVVVAAVIVSCHSLYQVENKGNICLQSGCQCLPNDSSPLTIDCKCTPNNQEFDIVIGAYSIPTTAVNISFSSCENVTLAGDVFYFDKVHHVHVFNVKRLLIQALFLSSEVHLLVENVKDTNVTENMLINPQHMSNVTYLDSYIGYVGGDTFDEAFLIGNIEFRNCKIGAFQSGAVKATMSQDASFVLQDSKVQLVESGAFQISVHTFHISNSTLQIIERGAFQINSSLFTMNSNTIRDVDAPFEVRSQTVELAGNKFPCDCNMLPWVLKGMQAEFMNTQYDKLFLKLVNDNDCNSGEKIKIALDLCNKEGGTSSQSKPTISTTTACPKNNEKSAASAIVTCINSIILWVLAMLF